MLVLDPHGQPAPYATIQHRSRSQESVETGTHRADIEGRYFPVVAPGTLHDFMARDSLGRLRAVTVKDVRSDAGRVELRLRTRVELVLEVRAPDGSPVELFDVELMTASGMDAGPPRKSESGAARRPERHLNGRVSLSIPDESFRILVRAEAYESLELGPFALSRTSAKLLAVLVPLPGFHGTVLGPAGPLQGARVSLHRAARAEDRRGPAGRDRAEPVSTDLFGRFHLPAGDGLYHLRAEASDLAPAEIGPFAVSPDSLVQDLVIELRPGGSIEGRVHLPAERSPSMVRVIASHGGGIRRYSRLDEQGRYRIDHLPPGKWLVQALEDGAPYVTRVLPGGAPRELPWSCVVREGQVTRFDVELVLVVLAGRLAFDDRPATGWSAHLSPPRGTWARAELDEDGYFELSVSQPGEHRLLLVKPGDSSAESAHIEHHLDLRPGWNDFGLDIPTGGVEGSLGPLCGASTSKVLATWESPQGITFSTWVLPCDAGRYRFSSVPTGRVRLFAASEGCPAPAGLVDVTPGDIVLFDMP